MESYNEKILPNTSVEVIQVSFDQNVGEAGKWARGAGLPWPVILRNEIPEEIKNFSTGGAIPDYVLVKSDGEVVANGKEAAFRVIEKNTSD